MALGFEVWDLEPSMVGGQGPTHSRKLEGRKKGSSSPQVIWTPFVMVT